MAQSRFKAPSLQELILAYQAGPKGGAELEAVRSGLRSGLGTGLGIQKSQEEAKERAQVLKQKLQQFQLEKEKFGETKRAAGVTEQQKAEELKIRAGTAEDIKQTKMIQNELKRETNILRRNIADANEQQKALNFIADVVQKNPDVAGKTGGLTGIFKSVTDFVVGRPGNIDALKELVNVAAGQLIQPQQVGSPGTLGMVELPEFKTEEEARSAGHGKGDRIIINGVTGTLD